MRHRLPLLLTAVSLLLLPIPGVAAEPVYRRSFDGPETHWRLVDTGVPSRLLAQDIQRDGERDDAAAERIVVAAPAGQSLQLLTPTPPAAVLDELEIRLWVKADRPNIQLAARVVLPRTAHRQGEAAVVVVRGATYDRPGRWQQLVLKDVPRLLAAQVRVLRSAPDSPPKPIDPREAFMDAAMLVVPGDPNGVEVATAELQVDGILAPNANARGLQSANDSLASSPATGPKASAFRLQGGTLFIDDRPFVPRVIQWQGEPLAFLAARGFNVVRLTEPPSRDQIAEARRHALWFICTPPRLEALSDHQPGEALRRLAEENDRVLAWYLENQAARLDPGYALRWAGAVRERDAAARRPIAIMPEGEWTTAHHAADILFAGHPRMGVISAPDFSQWLDERPPLVRPGTPLWACLATQFDDTVHRQCSALAGVELAAPSVEGEQLERLTRIACARAMRGFVFDSGSSLNAPDAAARQRAMLLERINRRLQLIEPWLATGNVAGQVVSADGASTGFILHVDRARLVIPITRPGASPDDSSARETTFVVPGVPESSQAFMLTPGALRALATQRVAGGVRLTLPSAGDAFLVFTEDPQVIHNLRQQIARDGPRIVRLERDYAALRAADITNTAEHLTRHGYSNDLTAQYLTTASAHLQQCESLLAAGRVEQAYQLAVSASVDLDRASAVQRRAVNQGPGFQPLLTSHPLALSYQHLAAYAAFGRAWGGHRGGVNLLYGGDFEDLGQMTRFGWRHFRHPLPGIESRAELSAAGPKQGGSCLVLHATATAAATSARPVASSAPVWIESPPVPIAAGQVVEITGWVHIAQPPAGGDGLQIVDSLGGPELSLAVRETAGWQPFRMTRAAPESTELRLTFALAGLGTARVDAVMVRVLESPAPPAR